MGQFHDWAQGPVPIRAAKVRGHEMSVHTVCPGWHWQPYTYTREATDVNGARVLAFPDWMVRLRRFALRETGHDDASVASYTPDTALVNFYDEAARLGMHQDKDERSLGQWCRCPSVTAAPSDSATPTTAASPTPTCCWPRATCSSSEARPGPARLAHHGVTKIHEGTAPERCGLSHGRINITMRMTGLAG